MQKHFEIRYLSLTVTLTALQTAELPAFLGSTLRGVVGQALLQTDQEACAFLYRNGDGEINGKVAAKPYMILPPKVCTPQTVIEQGDYLKFKILLFGRAEKYLSSVVSALVGIGRFGLGARRYQFELRDIIDSQTQRIVWRRGKYFKAAATAAMVPYREMRNAAGAVVELCTPLRIRHGGRLLRTLSFQTLIRNITNRIADLTERYGGWLDKEEADKVLESAGNIQTVYEGVKMIGLERYSNRIDRKMDFSGLCGRIEYAGEMSQFVPWLYAAQCLHIGRNTTFGMGKIQVYFIR